MEACLLLNLTKPSFNLSIGIQPFQPAAYMEPQTKHLTNPFSYPPPEVSHPPFKTEFTSYVLLNPVNASASYPREVHYAPNPSEIALQEIVKSQVKQTELSSFIAEQQRFSSLPVQEPPAFGGSFFDYPIFTRASKQSLKVVCQQTRKDCTF